MPRLTEGEHGPFAVPLERATEAWLAGLPRAPRASHRGALGRRRRPIRPSPRWRVPASVPFAPARSSSRSSPTAVADGDRKAAYHDPDAPPTHAYLAFYLGLRAIERIDALIHLGTHGTTEWLPGKAVALSAILLAAPRDRRRCR